MTIVGARTVWLSLDLLAQLNSTTLLPFGSTGAEYFTVGTTTSVAFAPLTPPYIAKYTIDTNGKIIVVSIYLSMFSNNSANGRSKLQVSGDGGGTWKDVTNEIPTAVQGRIGAGLWITEVLPGLDMLQFQVVGWSTTAPAPATIIVRTDSYIEFILNKKII